MSDRMVCLFFSNSWTRTRYLSTAKSYQSSFPGAQVRGRPTHLNDTIARTVNRGVCSSLHNSKPLSVANSSPFSRAAGGMFNTIDFSSSLRLHLHCNGSLLIRIESDPKQCKQGPKKFCVVRITFVHIAKRIKRNTMDRISFVTD